MPPNSAAAAADPAVSFVVLAYNHARFIRDCIDSILAQEETIPFEIIVIDDCSSDGTVAVLDSYADPRLTVIRHAVNQGHAATVTDGLRRARAPLIARIDGDDRYRPEFLRETVPIFAQFPTVALVYGDAALIDESGLLRHTRCQTYLPEGRCNFQKNVFVPLLEDNFICAPTIIARREAWLGCLPIPEGLAFHDWYFTLQMARRAPFYYRDRVLADYRVHPHNLHIAIIRSRMEEPSLFRLLDAVYRETEATPALERAKRRARTRIYASRYLEMATKYFGQHMDRDARRCYHRVLRRRPWWIFKPAVARRLIGTYIGREAYNVLKRWWL